MVNRGVNRWQLAFEFDDFDFVKASTKKIESIFQIPNSPPYPPISMLNLAEFCCQKPKTLPTTLIWGERGFFHWKIDFLFCLNSFAQDCSYRTFISHNMANIFLVSHILLLFQNYEKFGKDWP